MSGVGGGGDRVGASGDGAIQRHRRRFNVRGRTAAAAQQAAAAAQAAAEINNTANSRAAAGGGGGGSGGNDDVGGGGADLNVSTEDVVIHEESSSGGAIGGHQGPFSGCDDITMSRDHDALYDVQVLPSLSHPNRTIIRPNHSILGQMIGTHFLPVSPH